MKNNLKYCLLFLLICLNIPIIGFSQVRGGMITWEMEERFGGDDNNFISMIDLPNHKDYAAPPSFEVEFQFDHTPPTKQELGVSDDVNKHLTAKWYINGKLEATINKPNGTSSYFKTDLMEEVTYGVRSEFIYQNGANTIIYESPEIDARPDDILIVALGDSYGSGEGNPDRTKVHPDGLVWADVGEMLNKTTGSDNGNTPAPILADHFVAHRSTTAWSAQAAVLIEKSDPHTSVTYINLASGGAQTGNLIHTCQKKNWGNIPYIQTDEAKRIVGDRTIDALVISTGGNDMGFMEILMAYLLRKVVPGISFGDIMLGIQSGNWDKGKFKVPDFFADKVEFTNNPGALALPQLYDDLKNKIQNRLPDTRQVYLLQYPDIGAGCNHHIMKMDYMGLTYEIDSDEINHARQNVIAPLNNLIAQKCQQFGWIPISPGDWTDHGYCKSRPPLADFNRGFGFQHSYAFPSFYNNPSISWINNYDESEKYQGNILGVAHPNAYGHRALAKAFLDQMIPVNSVENVCGKKQFVVAKDKIISSNNCNYQLSKGEGYLWKAGNEIILDQGFDSQIGTNFEGLIDPKLRN